MTAEHDGEYLIEQSEERQSSDRNEKLEILEYLQFPSNFSESIKELKLRLLKQQL